MRPETHDAGDPFVAVESEKRAREIADFRQEKQRSSKMARQQAARANKYRWLETVTKDWIHGCHRVTMGD